MSNSKIHRMEFHNLSRNFIHTLSDIFIRVVNVLFFFAQNISKASNSKHHFIIKQSIKLIQGNSKIDKSWLCHDIRAKLGSIFAWVKLLEFSLKRYAQR
jgi:hypothetical protein